MTPAPIAPSPRTPGEARLEAVLLEQPGGPARAWLAREAPGVRPAFGGVRRRSYSDQAAARADALGLARAMAAKCALFELPVDGAKLVLFETGEDVEAAYRWLGGEVERLGGALYTGPDVATGARELAWLAGTTRYCVRPEDAAHFARATATGVVGGLRAGLARATGSGELAGRDFLVQGLGQVGELVVALLLESGGRVMASELDPERARRVGAALGIRTLAPGEEVATPCDALVPCALGGWLTAARAGRLGARVVCGCANGLVAEPSAAETLHVRGVVLVPDPIASAGALLRGVGREVLGADPDDGAIASRVCEVASRALEAASAAGLSPEAWVRALVRGEVAPRGGGAPDVG